jgi:hypothetical protein
MDKLSIKKKIERLSKQSIIIENELVKLKNIQNSMKHKNALKLLDDTTWEIECTSYPMVLHFVPKKDTLPQQKRIKDEFENFVVDTIYPHGALHLNAFYILKSDDGAVYIRKDPEIFGGEVGKMGIEQHKFKDLEKLLLFAKKHNMHIKNDRIFRDIKYEKNKLDDLMNLRIAVDGIINKILG